MTPNEWIDALKEEYEMKIQLGICFHDAYPTFVFQYYFGLIHVMLLSGAKPGEIFILKTFDELLHYIKREPSAFNFLAKIKSLADFIKPGV